MFGCSGRRLLHLSLVGLLVLARDGLDGRAQDAIIVPVQPVAEPAPAQPPLPVVVQPVAAGNQYGSGQSRSEPVQQQPNLIGLDMLSQLSRFGFRQPPPGAQAAPSSAGGPFDFLQAFLPEDNKGGDHSDFVKNMIPAGAPKGAQQAPGGGFDIDFYRHMMPRSAQLPAAKAAPAAGQPAQQPVGVFGMDPFRQMFPPGGPNLAALRKMIPQSGAKIIQDLMPGSGKRPADGVKGAPQQQQQQQQQQPPSANMDAFLRRVPGMSGLQENLRKMLAGGQRGPGQQQPGGVDFLRQVPGMGNLQQSAAGFQESLRKMLARADPKRPGQLQNAVPDMDFLQQVPGMGSLQQGASGLQANLRNMLAGVGGQKGPFGGDLAPNWLNMSQLMNGESIGRMSETVTLKTGEKISPVDYFMLDVLPRLYNGRPANENGTFSQYKELALTDESNDDAVHLSAQELIVRSGFKYELYDALADDGYITQITRVVNPLVERSQLRYPPIVMEHGGTIDPAVYLVASSIQHFPEHWPRRPEDGPMRSSNRSLAFMLANNGFDVFLCETRGSNDYNNRHLKMKALKSNLKGKHENLNRTYMENVEAVTKQWDFWAFTQDDIIAHEFKSHIDTVMKVTGAQHVAFFTFSLSTPTGFAFLSLRPDYARKIHGFVSMAPITTGKGFNMFMKIVMERACPMVPDSIGTFVFTHLMFSQPVRDMTMMMMKNKRLRYSLFKTAMTMSMGSSAQYRTNLELNVLGHLMRRLSFKEAKQMCQQMSSDRLQKYDYGPIKNMQLYGTPEPPVYDISNLQIHDWLLVSGWNDAFSTPAMVDDLLKRVNPKPIAHVVAPYNHLDLVAAFDNDKYTNRPILEYFERMSSIDPRQSQGGQVAESAVSPVSSIAPPSAETESQPAESTVRSMSIDLKPLLAPLRMLDSSGPVIPASYNRTASYARSLSSAARSFRVPVSRMDDPSLLYRMPNIMARSFGRSMRTVLDGIGRAMNDPRIELPITIHEVETGNEGASNGRR